MDTNDIPACEKLVMKVIWDSTEELALQEVMDGVSKRTARTGSHPDCFHIFIPSGKKGFLNMYRKGRYCYYQPLVSKEDFWRATMEESAKFFTKGDLGELACCLCDDMLDAKDIEKLKKKLNEHS